MAGATRRDQQSENRQNHQQFDKREALFFVILGLRPAIAAGEKCNRLSGKHRAHCVKNPNYLR